MDRTANVVDRDYRTALAASVRVNHYITPPCTLMSLMICDYSAYTPLTAIMLVNDTAYPTFQVNSAFHPSGVG